MKRSFFVQSTQAFTAPNRVHFRDARQVLPEPRNAGGSDPKFSAQEAASFRASLSSRGRLQNQALGGLNQGELASRKKPDLRRRPQHRREQIDVARRPT